MRIGRSVRAGGVGLALAATLACGPRAPAPAPELWLYHATNFGDPAVLETLEPVWRRAAAAGYRRVVLADGKFSRLGRMDSSYVRRVERARALAGELGLEIVPAVFPIGRSSPILALDPHLAEGLPVRGALFEARGGVARLVPDPPIRIPARPDRLEPEVRLEAGAAAIRDNRRTARALHLVPLSPYRFYRLTVEVATRDFSGAAGVVVLGAGRPIHFMRSLGVAGSQDWTPVHLAFHSLEHDRVAIVSGVWGPGRGEVRFRGWRLEETGPVNVLRRPGLGFVAEGAVEGVDFEPVVDPALGRSPWPGQYDEWHEPPPIRTRLPDGARFRASWHQAAVLFGGQVTCCLSEPGLDSLLDDEARRVRALFAPARVMMMHDEIRVLNQDASCRKRRTTPGAILAGHARRCVERLAGVEVLVWSDMFDPFHHAVRDYELVDGDLAGSWEGLPPEVVVVNWNGARARESLRFFAGRGHPQVIAGFYDGPPGAVAGWLDAARGVPGVRAVLYATWRGDYRQLEAFARAVAQGARAGGRPRGGRGVAKGPRRRAFRTGPGGGSGAAGAGAAPRTGPGPPAHRTVETGSAGVLSFCRHRTRSRRHHPEGS